MSLPPMRKMELERMTLAEQQAYFEGELQRFCALQDAWLASEGYAMPGVVRHVRALIDVVFSLGRLEFLELWYRERDAGHKEQVR